MRPTAMAIDPTRLTDCGPVDYAPKEQIAPERKEAEAALRDIPGVRGVGEGQDGIGDPAWIVYVTDQSVAGKLPRSVGGRKVVAEISGEIDILPA
jgi:hypothetical protein